MSNRNISMNLRRYFRHLYNRPSHNDLVSYKKIIHEITKLQRNFENADNAQLRHRSLRLKKKVRPGGDLNPYLPEAFALVKEVIRRVLNIVAYDVQLIGGVVIHQGKIAEMKTGEGKTLTAVFPAYLNALSGQGVHLLTFNDYLASRDAKWMGPVYEFLGISVGCVQEGMTISERQKAYNADITYLSAKEAGFDFLRDSLCFTGADIVHRPFRFAIVDEADSILIDEARVPMVIADAAQDSIADSYRIARIVRQFEEGTHFEFDEYARNLHMTDKGLQQAECQLQCNDLYLPQNIDLLTRLNCAIHAEFLLRRDIDYIVRDHKIELVDEFTGRVADKRRWPDGLQAALEAKEEIPIQDKGTVLNSITLYNFMQKYAKIGGMTATARPAESEFKAFYNLEIVSLPPNQPCIRQDHPDKIYPNKACKHKALIEEIEAVHRSGQPVLVGTCSVRESILLAGLLRERGIRCQVLNARNDAREADIIAKAGRLGAVTISTNMAGRGTDIKLGGADEEERAQVATLGGLYVIGTNKHESERIDNQLRGRSGRQGDPGASKFLVSLEDDIFVKYKLTGWLSPNLCRVGRNGTIDHPSVGKAIARIQGIIEAQNLESKKTLRDYAGLIDRQRALIVAKRADSLEGERILDFYKSGAPDAFDRLKHAGKEELVSACRFVSLCCIDRFWSDYLSEIADLREGIHLTRLGGQNPLLEFHKQAIAMFDHRFAELDSVMLTFFGQLKIKANRISLEDTGLKVPSATWTYLVNDNPFDDLPGIEMIGNISSQLGAGLLGLGSLAAAIIPLARLWRRRKRRV